MNRMRSPTMPVEERDRGGMAFARIQGTTMVTGRARVLLAIIAPCSCISRDCRPLMRKKNALLLPKGFLGVSREG